MPHPRLASLPQGPRSSLQGRIGGARGPIQPHPLSDPRGLADSPQATQTASQGRSSHQQRLLRWQYPEETTLSEKEVREGCDLGEQVVLKLQARKGP